MMANKTYDILKWFAMIVLPALATMYAGLASTWGLPYGDQIPATITLVNTFLGAVLMISNNQYRKQGDSDEDAEKE